MIIHLMVIEKDSCILYQQYYDPVVQKKRALWERELLKRVGKYIPLSWEAPQISHKGSEQTILCELCAGLLLIITSTDAYDHHMLFQLWAALKEQVKELFLLKKKANQYQDIWPYILNLLHDSIELSSGRILLPIKDDLSQPDTIQLDDSQTLSLGRPPLPQPADPVSSVPTFLSAHDPSPRRRAGSISNFI